jgi:hypothetical protein
LIQFTVSMSTLLWQIHDGARGILYFVIFILFHKISPRLTSIFATLYHVRRLDARFSVLGDLYVSSGMEEITL